MQRLQAQCCPTKRGSLLMARCSSASMGAGASGGSSRRSEGSRARRPQHPATPTGIFQLHPYPNISMNDIRDAVEACEVCRTREERKRCMESFGLNSVMVDAYYPIVVEMENKLDQDDDIGRKVAGFIGMMFLMLFTSKVM